MINIISKRELSNSVIYELDDNILRSNIISILKMENISLESVVVVHGMKMAM
jgi:hypothetical protein